jgi:hypothetical protein
MYKVKLGFGFQEAYVMSNLRFKGTAGGEGMCNRECCLCVNMKDKEQMNELNNV